MRALVLFWIVLCGVISALGLVSMFVFWYIAAGRPGEDAPLTDMGGLSMLLTAVFGCITAALVLVYRELPKTFPADYNIP